MCSTYDVSFTLSCCACLPLTSAPHLALFKHELFCLCIERKYSVRIEGSISVTYWSESIQCGLLDRSWLDAGAKVFGVNRRIAPPCSSCSDMLHQKREHDAERTDAASAPKRIRASAAGRGMEAGFKADPVMIGHCSTPKNTEGTNKRRHGTLPVESVYSDRVTGTCDNGAAQSCCGKQR